MNKRTVSVLATIVFIVQIFVTIPAFAQQDTGFVVDFSGTSGYSVTNCVENVQDYKIVKGQYGKSSDDSSIRLYSVGGTYTSPGSQTLRIDPVMDTANSGEYIHVAYEYLREDLCSGLTVRMSIIDSDGNVMYDRNIAQHLTGGSSVGQVRILNNATNSSTSGTHYNFTELGGIWKRIDLYFSPDSDKAKVFLDGKYVVEKNLTTGSSGWGGSTFKPGVADVFRVNFLHILDTKATREPTAVQVDNIIVEKVDSIPDSIDYVKSGEIINFEDDASIISGKNGVASYGVSFYNTTTAQDDVVQKYANYYDGRPSVHFKSIGNNSLESGIYGKKSWDDSLHTQIPSDGTLGANAMYYHPGASDLATGYAGHLTFAVANESLTESFTVNTKYTTVGDTTKETNLFAMSPDSGKFEFFGEETNKTWENKKWYRVDMQFKVSDSGTSADCFVDGEKLVSDYAWFADGLKDIGLICFADSPNADYYIDDIAYYICEQKNTKDLSKEIGINTNDTELSEAIDNSKRLITISGSYKVEDFLNKITNPENVKIYNANGEYTYNGFLSNCDVAVSCGIGYELYYTIEKSATVYEAELFDTADNSMVIVKNKQTLEIAASDLELDVINMDIYIDGKLVDSVNTDIYSVNLDELPLGKHSFDVYAYVNDKDCYLDSVNLVLTEENITELINWDLTDVTSLESGIVPGGRLVMRGGKILPETVTDSNSVNYGTSMVFRGTKEEYAGYNNAQALYYDLYTPNANVITKAMVEFDFCLLNDKARFAMTYRGKTDFNSTSITATNFAPAMVSKSFTYNGQTIELETNKWYRLKNYVDVKNKISGLWIDDVCYGDGVPISTQMVQIASELRIEMMYPSGYYDTADTLSYIAVDNVLFTECDELAYIKTVEDAVDSSGIAYNTNKLKIQLSGAVEAVNAEDFTLRSTNGDRGIASAQIDSKDSSVVYITPENNLTSAERYTVLISKGLKSNGATSTKENSGMFVTKPESFDVTDGGFINEDGAIKFKMTIANNLTTAKSVTIIVLAYEGDELKTIVPKTIRVNPGKTVNPIFNVPYVSQTAKYYAFAADGWENINPISNKLFTYSY